MPSKRFFLASLVLCLTSQPALAHFLFVRITPPAEAGRAAEVTFSDNAHSGDDMFVDKIAHTKLWLQSAPGTFQPLPVNKAADRLRSLLPGSGSFAVIGACEYGVLTRKTSFLLRYFPKALAGKPEELNRLQPFKEVPVEIIAQIKPDGLQLQALKDGKPFPGALFMTAVPEGDVGTAMKANEEGKATWKPTAGNHSVYFSAITKKAGDRAGKKYEEIRDFATLAFTWPLSENGADPKAVALFQEALAARGHWKDFPGFSAHIQGYADGKAFSGTVTIQASGAVDAKIANQNALGWVQEQLESIVLHRGAGNSSRSTGKSEPIIRFGDKDIHHPLGRLLIFEGGRFASSYRVKDKQIMVVNRHLGKENMTITVLENDQNKEGQFLPRTYTVQYWDAAKGNLKRTETIQDRWLRVGSWDLPASHTVAVASDTGLAARTFTLSKHVLLNAKK
jgi:hypothetical protein